MTTAEIETAIMKLPASEVGALMSWLENYHEQLWDKQIEEDLEAGRLDDILAEAEREYEAGLSRPI